MYETRAEIKRLQELLESSRKKAGKHILGIFTDDRKLSAQQVCTHLRGIKQVAMATTTTKKGKPRVAPVDAAFVHGRFCISTDLNSMRIRNLRGNSSVSMTYFEDISVAIIVHGSGTMILAGDEDFAELKREWTRHYGKEMIKAVEDALVFVRVEPEQMFAMRSSSKEQQ